MTSDQLAAELFAIHHGRDFETSTDAETALWKGIADTVRAHAHSPAQRARRPS